VLAYPEKIEPLSMYQIRSLAFSTLPELKKTTKTEYTLLIDEDGVDQLIDEFPEVLTLRRKTHRGDSVHFGLAECPFVERAHRDQYVGTGKSAIILNEAEGYLRFKCFSDECSGHGIGDLLRLLRERTGRRFSMPIWEDDYDELAAFEKLGVEEADPEYVVAEDEDEEQPMTAAELRAALGMEIARPVCI
jgi:uncharacterized protein YrzB (UPF0473 family)